MKQTRRPKGLPLSSCQLVQPSEWPRAHGYAHGMMAEGKLLFIAGQIGWDPSAPKPALKSSFVAQFEQALANVMRVLEASGGNPEHLVRINLYVTRRSAYLRAQKELGQIWRRYLGNHYPAMALLVVSGLLEKAAQVEMEATAVLPRRRAMRSE